MSDKSKRSIRPIIGVFLILLALFLEVSLVTHSTADNVDWHNIADKPAGFSNWGGVVGNFFATDLFRFFGIVSYLLAAMVGLWGIFLIWRKQISVLPLKILCLVIFIASALSLAGLIAPDFKTGRMDTLGGWSGMELASFAIKYFGAVGSFLLTLFVLGTSIILATDWLAYDIGAKFGRIIYVLASKFIGFINTLRQGIDRRHEQDKMIKQLTRPSMPTPVAPIESDNFDADEEET